MSLSDAQIDAEARLLDEAERNRRQTRQTTSIHPDVTIEDATGSRAPGWGCA